MKQKPTRSGANGRIAQSFFNHRQNLIIPHGPPLLYVVIDTEEEFDWRQPLARHNTAVASIDAQPRGQEIYCKWGIVPTYVVDFPVASNERSVRMLKGFLDEGACTIGAHLHPWVNPPHDEAVTPRNSYPGNLPPDLEEAKLIRLGDAIATAFATRPTIYKAGRYGVGPNTAASLERLGYDIDVSIVPRTDFSSDGGPDFRECSEAPFWFGMSRRLLALPLTTGFSGLLHQVGHVLFPRLETPFAQRLRAPAPFARLRLLERIRLTPEGVDLAAQKRLVSALVDRGCRLFHYTLHSPSLSPGNTPYVHDRKDLASFLQRMDEFFRFFINDLGGRPTTPAAVFAELAATSKAPLTNA